MGWEGEILSAFKYRIFRKRTVPGRYMVSREGKNSLDWRALTASYGIKEMCRMLFWPMKFSKESNRLREITNRGHELGVHGYVHVKWNCLNQNEMEMEFHEMISAYENIFQEKPTGFSAPLAFENDDVNRLLDKYAFKYCSVMSGNEIQHPPDNDSRFSHVAIPVTIKMTDLYIPPIEFFHTSGFSEQEIIDRMKALIDKEMEQKGWASTFLHARNEGVKYLKSFEMMLIHIREQGYRVKTFYDICSDFKESLRNN
ncbi:polysaccharide deacetylase family protein [Thermodesulfobacteriota bacterium]